jgi:hypothetical protein
MIVIGYIVSMTIICVDDVHDVFVRMALVYGLNQVICHNLRNRSIETAVMQPGYFAKPSASNSMAVIHPAG